MRGEKLYAPLQGLDLRVPAEATHLVVVSANEAGLSTHSQSIALGDDLPGGSDALFTRRATLGVLGGLASESPVLASCVTGATAMMHEAETITTQPAPGSTTQSSQGSSVHHSDWRQTLAASAQKSLLLKKSLLEERSVTLMLRKTPADMRAALHALADWLHPIVSMLRHCGRRVPAAHDANGSLVRALGHLSAPKDFNYLPGKALDIDGTTIFLGINHAIGELRKDKPANFGMAVGEFLKPLGLAPAEKAFETKQDQHYQSPGTELVSEHGGLRTLSAGVKYFVFSVKAAHDAHIALFREEMAPGMVRDNASVLYEFVIDESDSRSLSKLCAIRFGKSGKNEAEARVEDALDTGKFRDFWISADAATGRVALGKGLNIGGNVIVNMTDAPPGVRGSPKSFAVMTPASFGAWRFPEAEQDASNSTPASSASESSSTSEPGEAAISVPLSLKANSKVASRARPTRHPKAGRSSSSRKAWAGADKSTESTSRLVLRPPQPALAESATGRMRQKLHMASSKVGIGAVPEAN